MNVAVLSLVLVAAPPDQPQLLLDAMSAKLGNVRSYQVEYERATLHLVDRTKLKKLAKDKKTKKANPFQMDPDSLLAEDDPRALVSKGRVRMARDREDYCYSELRSDSQGAVSYRLVYTNRKGVATKYRSKSEGADTKGALSEFNSMSLAIVGHGDLFYADTSTQLVPERVVYLLNDQLLARTVFLNNEKINNSRKEPWNLEHMIETDLPEAFDGIVIRTTFVEKRFPNHHPYRQLFFDSQKGPMPVRIHLQSSAVRTEYSLQWKLFAAEGNRNVWFPTEIRKAVFFNKGAQQTKPYHVDTAKLDEAKCCFNCSVDDGALSFQLPVGTVVKDTRTGEDYVVATDGNNTEALQRLLEHQLPTAADANYRYVYLVCGAGIALAILIVTPLRRFRARTSAVDPHSSKATEPEKKE
jgi:hypothetical protein